MLGATANRGEIEIEIEIEIAIVLASLIAGSVACGVLIAGLAGLGRRHASGPMMRWIDGLCGVALTWFGARLLWSTIRRASGWLSPIFRAVGSYGIRLNSG